MTYNKTLKELLGAVPLFKRRPDLRMLVYDKQPFIWRILQGSSKKSLGITGSILNKSELYIDRIARFYAHFVPPDKLPETLIREINQGALHELTHQYDKAKHPEDILYYFPRDCCFRNEGDLKNYLSQRGIQTYTQKDFAEGLRKALDWCDSA